MENNNLKIEKKISKYLILEEVLGKGGQAICKKALLQEDLREVFAVKQISKLQLKEENRNEKFKKRMTEEINSLKQLKGVNIVRYVDIFETQNYIYLFLEYCNQKSLEHLVARRGGKLSELETIQIFRSLKSAFYELYQKKIIHRDIKPQNILIHNGQIKLADFGFSKTLDDMNIDQKMTLCGTPQYVSKEILFSQKYSSKCDVYSLGTMIYEFLYGKYPYYPYRSNDLNTLRVWITENQLQFPEEIKIYNPFLIDLLQSLLININCFEEMLQKTEDLRIGWEEVFQHPFFTDYEEKAKNMAQQILASSNNQNAYLLANDQYLDQHLIHQDFDPVILGNCTQESLDAQSANSVFLKMVSQSELQKLVQQYKNYEELINNMHAIIEYERNIAIFFFQIVKQFRIVHFQMKITLPLSLLNPFLYSLTKTGMIFLNQILNLTSKDPKCLHEDLELVKYFEKSQLYATDKKNVMNQYYYYFEFKDQIRFFKNQNYF